MTRLEDVDARARDRLSPLPRREQHRDPSRQPRRNLSRFGALKLFPGASPAQDLVQQTTSISLHSC